MKSWTICGVFALLVIGCILIIGCTTNAPSAQPTQTPMKLTTPNLTGTWKVEAHGEVIPKTSTPSPYTHFSSPNETITATAVITSQEGRVLRGKFVAPQGDGENFIAMIGQDNTTWHFADEDGSSVGEIVNDSLIYVIYTQITQNETVMATSTWTRIK